MDDETRDVNDDEEKKESAHVLISVASSTHLARARRDHKRQPRFFLRGGGRPPVIHESASRGGKGVLGEKGIIVVVVDFFCAVFSSFVFIKSMYVLLRIEVYIIGSGRFFFLRGGGAFFFFGRIVV